MTLGYALDLPLHGPDGFHIFVELSPIDRPKTAVKGLGVIHDEVEDASVLLMLLNGKEPVKHGLRISKGSGDMTVTIP